MSVCVWVVCVWASADAVLLTHTPPPTSGVGWYTRSLQTQTGRFSSRHHYNEQRTNVIISSVLFFFFNIKRWKKGGVCELTHHQAWAGWARWWTEHRSCPVRIPLRCWAWMEGPPASAPAETTEEESALFSFTEALVFCKCGLIHQLVDIIGWS